MKGLEKVAQQRLHAKSIATMINGYRRRCYALDSHGTPGNMVIRLPAVSVMIV